MGLLVFYILFTLLVSFLCSLLESVLLSVTPAYIAVSLKEKKKSAKLFEKFKSRMDEPLAAILSLNTIANTLGAAGVGAETFKLFGSAFVAIISALLTFSILLFSEILPKTLGATRWKQFAGFCAYTIQGLIYIMYPLIYISSLVRGLFYKKGGEKITREEMIATAHLSQKGGDIRPQETRVIQNLLQLEKMKVSEIMTPRTVVKAFDWNRTVDDVMKQEKTLRFSRMPVYDSDLDNVKGLLHRYEVLNAYSMDAEMTSLKKLMTPIHAIPEKASVLAALNQFIQRKEHLFLVLDEYGSTAGIVTLEDAIETLLGVEIIDELDSVADMRELASKRWKEKKQSVSKLKKKMNVRS